MGNMLYRNNDRSGVHRAYPRVSSSRMIVSRYTGILGVLGVLLVSACKNPQTPANPSPSRKMLPSPLEIGYPGLPLKPDGTISERSGSNNPVRGNVSQLTVVYSYSPANAGGLKEKPDWLLVDADGRIDVRNVPAGDIPAPGEKKIFKIRVTGIGDYKGNTDIDFVITGSKLSLPAMSYDSRNLKRSSIDSIRRISVNLKGGLPFKWADYAFEPAGSKPLWLNISADGTLSGTMPNSASTAEYTIKAAGKGIYDGTRNVTFTLTVNPAEFSVSYSGTTGPAGAASASIDMGAGKNGKSRAAAYDITVPDSNITELTPALMPAVEGDTPPSAVYTLDPTGKILSEAAKFFLNADNGKITKNTSAGALSPPNPFIITVKGKSGTIYEGHEQKVYIYIRTTI